MSDPYIDGTVIIGELDMAPFNIFVKDSDSGWDDRAWWQTGCEVPVTLPDQPFKILFTP